MRQRFDGTLEIVIVDDGSSDGTLNLKLITTRPGEGRAVALEYYVFGVKRQVTVLPGAAPVAAREKSASP